MNKKQNEVPIPLLAFTFFFTLCIYTMLLGFIFWDRHRDGCPPEQ